MSGVQNKKKDPGAWNSCLEPYMQELFDLYFRQRKSARFIQKYLLEKRNLDVSATTVWRFITVRQNRKDPRRKDPHRMSKTALANLRAVSAEPASESETQNTGLPVKAPKINFVKPKKSPEQIAAEKRIEILDNMSDGEFYD